MQFFDFHLISTISSTVGHSSLNTTEFMAQREHEAKTPLLECLVFFLYPQ